MSSDDFKSHTFSLTNSFTIPSHLPIFILPPSISLRCVENKRQEFFYFYEEKNHYLNVYQ